MSFLEQELRKILGYCSQCENPKYVGYTGYIRVNSDIRMRVEFNRPMVSTYDGLVLSMINRKEGVVDSKTLLFSDVWGIKPVDNPNFPEGVFPHIWEYRQRTDWYAYKPTRKDYRKLAETVDSYVELFQEVKQRQELQINAMPFLEHEMRKIVSNSGYEDKATFLGETCYVKLGSHVRMRLEFIGGDELHYDGLKMTMINYREGEVDNYTIRFVDALGLKGTDNPSCHGGVIPRIWNDGGELEWYLYHPEPSDYQKISEVVDNYADLFWEQEPVQGHQMNM